MADFKAQTFKFSSVEPKSFEYRDMQLDDLLGKKVECEVVDPIDELAEREKGIKGQEEQILALVAAIKERAMVLVKKESEMWDAHKQGGVIFARSLAEVVTDVKVEIDESVLRKAVDKLLDDDGKATKLFVRLSSADLTTLKERCPEMQDGAQNGTSIFAGVDELIPRGSAAIDTDNLRLDHNYADKIAKIRELLVQPDVQA